MAIPLGSSCLVIRNYKGGPVPSGFDLPLSWSYRLNDTMLGRLGIGILNIWERKELGRIVSCEKGAANLWREALYDDCRIGMRHPWHIHVPLMQSITG